MKSTGRYYCCHINYSSLGDTVLHHRTDDELAAKKWENEQGYFSRMVFTKEEYDERMTYPQYCDADPL